MTIEQTDLFGNVVVEPRRLPRSLLENRLAKQLKNISDMQLVLLMYTEFDAIVDYVRLCSGDKAGQQISSLFNPHRYDTDTIDSPSIVAALKTDSFAQGLSRAVAWKEGKVHDLLYQVLQLGINGIQYVNEFPPATARDIYSTYHAKTILDPCAGWGGRMIGAAAVGAHYHGYEPSTRTYEGLQELAEWLMSFDTGFTYQLDNTPFEDAKNLGIYDLALTSPPYFDTERYAEEPTQASVRWPTPALFVEGFFEPLIRKTTDACVQGLIVNIGSRRYPMRQWLTDTSGITATELPGFRLSGSSGLGKDNQDGETFWHVTHRRST